jgi:hypothetical protein
METDCTGCYNRMIPNTHLMNAQTMGASRNSCIALGKVWKNLKHHTQTGHGTSNEYYPKLESTYQGGAGQGSAYATLCTPDPLTISSNNTACYFDDLSVVFTPSQSETTQQNTTRITQSLSDMMERTGQKYEKLFHVAVGDLNLPKGHCYILARHWNTDGTSAANTIAQTSIDTKLTHDRNTTRVNIPPKETMEPCKTLGCHTAPDGSHKGQFKSPMTKEIHFGAAARHRGTTKQRSLHETQSLLLHRNHIPPRSLQHNPQRPTNHRKKIHQGRETTNGLSKYHQQLHDTRIKRLPRRRPPIHHSHQRSPPPTYALRTHTRKRHHIEHPPCHHGLTTNTIPPHQTHLPLPKSIQLMVRKRMDTTLLGNPTRPQHPIPQ